MAGDVECWGTQLADLDSRADTLHAFFWRVLCKWVKADGDPIVTLLPRGLLDISRDAMAVPQKKRKQPFSHQLLPLLAPLLSCALTLFLGPT
jgi:hypothetical protein